MEGEKTIAFVGATFQSEKVQVRATASESPRPVTSTASSDHPRVFGGAAQAGRGRRSDAPAKSAKMTVRLITDRP